MKMIGTDTANTKTSNGLVPKVNEIAVTNVTGVVTMILKPKRKIP